MLNFSSRRLKLAAPLWVALHALLLAAATQAHAQAAHQAPQRAMHADPLDPKADVPRAQPPAALSRYKRYADQPVGSWSEVNDTVTRIGGWRAYIREAQGAAPATTPPAPTPSSVTPPPATSPPATSPPAPRTAPTSGQSGHKH